MRNHKPVFAFVLAIAMTASASSANATETWSPPAEEEPAAPSRMKSAGIGLTAAGGVFLGAGGIVAAAGTTQEGLGQIPFLMGGGLLGGTGILLSAVGIPLWVAGAREESERDLAIVAGPSSVSVAGSF